jgi:hypothetical protein
MTYLKLITLIFLPILFFANENGKYANLSEINTAAQQKEKSKNSIKSSGDIYMVGIEYKQKSGRVSNAFVNKNGVTAYLPQSSFKNASASCIAIAANGDVYIGGTVSMLLPANNNEGAVYWKNGVLNEIYQNSSTYWRPDDIKINGNDIFIAGTGYTNSGRSFAKYEINGKEFIISDTTHNAEVRTLAVDGKNVYVGGWEVDPYTGNKIATIWINGQANYYNTVKNSNSEIYQILISGADVYAVGYEQDKNSNPQVAVGKYWVNGNPVNVTNGATDTKIECIQLQGSDIYLCGREKDIYGNYLVTYWYNGTPTTVSNKGFNTTYTNLALYNNSDVFIAYSQNHFPNSALLDPSTAFLWGKGSNTKVTRPWGNVFDLLIQ